MSKHKGYIDVCYIEEPFIFAVNGNFTLEELKTIEDNLIQDEYGLNEKYQGKEDVRFVVHYEEEEIQYGSGYGDVYRVPAYYDLTCVSDK